MQFSATRYLISIKVRIYQFNNRSITTCLNHRKTKKMKPTSKIISLVAALAVAGTLFLQNCNRGKATNTVETATAHKGNISLSITATGTIEAITTVEVGTQVSGVIKKLYADFNSSVKKGQLLATLDETMLQASLDQSKASLMDAEADFTYQSATYGRMKSLYDKNLISQADFDQVEYNYSRSLASVANAKASLQRSQVNLEYASIFSPIDGVVLNRAVDEGQTVAASFNTPTLFTIANDLTRMQVQANVDEADIGQVATGQRAEFSVDAYPEETFSGTVTEIRLQPVISSNVVTYTVIVNAPNPEKKLMPGMTASITVFSQESSGVIIIPAKALTFNPPSGTDSDGVKIAGNPGQAPHVWVYDGKKMLPKRVNTGLSDGNFTEIKSGLSAGEEVVTLIKEQQSSEPGEKKVTSPFIPKRPGGSKDKTPPPPQ